MMKDLAWLLFLAILGLAAALWENRGFAAEKMVKQKIESLSQGEQALKDPKNYNRSPASMNPRPKPIGLMGAGCRDARGAVYYSWQNPKGYQNCIEGQYELSSTDRENTGRGIWLLIR